MILISAALVLVAIGLLIAGVVLAKPFLVMWSIVVSVLSAVCLLIGALLRRHELFPAGGRAAEEPVQAPQGAAVPQLAHAGIPGHPGVPGQVGLPGHVGHPAFGGAPAHPVAHPMMGVPPAPPPGAQPPSAFPQQPARPLSRPPASASAGRELGPDAIVLVVPGRKRFHLADCRQLHGREVEELTHEEAREEGFTPCTSCVPEGAARVAAEPDEGTAGVAASSETTPSEAVASETTSGGITPSEPTSEATASEETAADGITAGETAVMETVAPAGETVPSVESMTKNTEPAEPAETADPGRAGSADPAGSTTATVSRSLFDPMVRPEDTADTGDTADMASPDVVMFMTGTRRYHLSGCPLIKAAPEGSVETKTRTEAEEAGLTPCPVCTA
ncbi:hypothetical protein [Microtetraspora sp. NBRC 16547]|uniref:hypothetical protein n=1 Tax=Microtetraspora sp. NBRC 16547 TaxID=3030993 RepID=UPI0024A39CF5|nr:hypothetical protein [Microtetraspora sp. NBRC 16547]GLW97314.1 hypothetical protein Misp02_14010 [Microtetraspora sp. NBRC 16547]